MIGGMKVKTSITLSSDLLDELDRLTDESSRSELIEEAVKAWLAARARSERDARELRMINRHARRLNREADDVLDYQE